MGVKIETLHPTVPGQSQTFKVEVGKMTIEQDNIELNQPGASLIWSDRINYSGNTIPGVPGGPPNAWYMYSEGDLTSITIDDAIGEQSFKLDQSGNTFIGGNGVLNINALAGGGDQLLYVDNTGNVGVTGMTTGAAGTSGTDGTSGTSGTDGTSGTSGTDGTSGTSGTDGTSGTSGTDGRSAYQGGWEITTPYLTGDIVFYSIYYQALQNNTGKDPESEPTYWVAINGTSGTSGVDGTSGTSGVDGTSGTSGVDGTSGTSGTSGLDGNVGEGSLNFEIISPQTGKTYYIELSAPYEYTLSGITTISDAGTPIFDVQVSLTGVTGLNPITGTTTKTEFLATSVATVSIGSDVSIYVRDKSTTTKLSGSIKITS